MPISKKAKYELAERLLGMDFLNEREKNILKLRLGIEGYKPCTLEEIGEKYGITRERVRQIGVAIVRKLKKFLPEEKRIAKQIFIKTWEPKYLAKKRRVLRRRGIIKRNKTIIRNKCKKLRDYINEFSITREGKERINNLFKDLRIKYRRNKSLFEQDVIGEIKNLRQFWKEIRKRKPVIDQGQIF